MTRNERKAAGLWPPPPNDAPIKKMARRLMRRRNNLALRTANRLRRKEK